MYLLFECLLLLLQPYPFFTDVNITTENAYSNYPIEYPLNDLLAILSLGRVAILFKTTLVLTPYMDNRGTKGLIQPTASARCTDAARTSPTRSSVSSRSTR